MNNGVVITSADPAAGAEISLNAPFSCLVRAFQVALVTDGNAANRQVHFTFEDPNGNIYFRAIAGGVQAATTTRQYSAFGTGYASQAVADTAFIVSIPIEGVRLPKGGKIKTVTTSKQVGDDFGILSVFAEKLALT